MAKSYTPNFDLTMDDENEYYDIEMHSGNMTKIDVALNTHKEKLASPMTLNVNDLQTGKKYKAGIQISAEGKPQFIYEEVV